MSNIMDQSHALALVTLPGGSRYLVDPTFAQFFAVVREGGSAPGTGVLGTVEGAELAATLLKEGVIPLTEDSARQYVIALGADTADSGAIAERLLAGDAAVVTDLIQDGKVERVEGSAEDNALNLANVMGVHGKQGSVEAVREAMLSLEPGDPRLALLEDLAAGLEALSHILPPLPEAAPK
jgi:hypothetical protein